MYEQQLKFAAQALANGNLAASEIVCRDVLDVAPQNSTALNLLGVIAARVGANDHSTAYFRKALKAEPNNDVIRKNLNFIKNAPRPDGNVNSANRYLVIKSWGYGFWSDVSQVLGSLLLAEITGRNPVTHWGKNSLFGDGSGQDSFELYFKPVSNVALRDLARIDGVTFFPPKWNEANLADENIAKWRGNGSRPGALNFLNRPETIAINDFYIGVVNVAPWIPADHPMHGKPLDEIYRYLVDKYLCPHMATHSACDTFFHAHLEGAPFVALHLRGSDKSLEDHNLHATNEAFLSALASVDPKWRIFLLTEDEQLLTRMKTIYGGRIIATNCQRTNTSTGLHYLPTVDRMQAGLEVMTDVYLALRANRFIGNGRSNVSAMIAVMKQWKPGDCTLIGRSQLMERNLSLHTAEVRF
jgi:protein O-GlcNAc transferase